MELDIEMLGEQLGDTLQEFVADDPETRATAYVILEKMKDSTVHINCGLCGYDKNCTNALIMLLLRCAEDCDDPEGWLAQLFIQAFHGLLKRMAEQ